MAKYKVIEKKKDLVYKIKSKKGKIKLSRSDSKTWLESVRGETVATLEDDGDKIIISFDQKTFHKIDYSTFGALEKLIQIKKKEDNKLLIPYKIKKIK